MSSADKPTDTPTDNIDDTNSDDAIPEPQGNPKTRPIRMVLTLALGGVGGVLFHELHMPLPWMIGALVFTLIASLSGAPLVRPKRLRIYMVPVLGVMLGAGFTPEAIRHATEWVASISMLLVYALGVTAMVSSRLSTVCHQSVGTKMVSPGPVMSSMGCWCGGRLRLIAAKWYRNQSMASRSFLAIHPGGFTSASTGGTADRACCCAM